MIQKGQTRNPDILSLPCSYFYVLLPAMNCDCPGLPRPHLPLRLLQSRTGSPGHCSSLPAHFLSHAVELLLQPVLLLLDLKQLQLQAALGTLGMLGNLTQLSSIQALQLLHLLLPQTLLPFKHLNAVEEMKRSDVKG